MRAGRAAGRPAALLSRGMDGTRPAERGMSAVASPRLRNGDVHRRRPDTAIVGTLVERSDLPPGAHSYTSLAVIFAEGVPALAMVWPSVTHLPMKASRRSYSGPRFGASAIRPAATPVTASFVQSVLMGMLLSKPALHPEDGRIGSVCRRNQRMSFSDRG